MNDIVNQEFTNKYNRKFLVVSYDGKEKKDGAKAYKHYYTIEFVKTKNRYQTDRNQIKRLTCRDLIQVEIDNKLAKKEKQKQRAKKNKSRTKKEYPVIDFTGKKILVLDLSSTSTGYIKAIGDKFKFGSYTFMNSFSKREICDLQQIPEIKLFLKNTDFRSRSFKMFEHLQKDIKIADIIFIEDVNGGENIKVGIMLAELRGFVLSTAYIYGKKVFLFGASEWRSAINVVTRPRKEAKKSALEYFYKETGRTDIWLDDISDAYGIWKGGKKLLSGE